MQSQEGINKLLVLNLKKKIRKKENDGTKKVKNYVYSNAMFTN